MKTNKLLSACAVAFAFWSLNTTGQIQQSAQVSNGQIQSQLQPANLNFQQTNSRTVPTFGSPVQFSPSMQSTSVPAGQHVCKTHELNQQHYSDRGIQNEFNQDYLTAAGQMASFVPPKTSGVNEIAIIFHVVHNPNNPAENVSNALIMQVYNDLVEDFLLQNTDAANVRPGFGFTPADANINFCLATQDPFGNPLAELGVIRVATTENWYDSDNGEENKMKSSATGGSQIWNRNNYLNVWICDISNGASSGTAGYAYRPSPSFLPGASIDGIVLDYNLGMNNENVLTHEVGHYLGLDHTWGGSGGCGNDDGFTDTPNTAGPSFNYAGSCGPNQQTCSGIETQYENYMDYANCTVMFTQEQANYMLMILQGIRGSLLLSPGCDPVDAPPVVAFTADISDPIIIPVGGSVQFTDFSTNAPNSWAWDFDGGATNSSVQNPLVTFNTIGTYDVTLDATNAFGTGTLTKPAHVQVVAAATGTGCDTLRNYNPSDDFYILYGAVGYIPGNEVVSTFDVLDWAEPYTALTSTEVRRLEFIPSRVSDGGGTISFKVYADAAGIPGAVLTQEDIDLVDMTELAWNGIDFTTPVTVTGNFWVGYEVSYANVLDTFALMTTYELSPAPVNFTNMFVANDWYPVSDIYGSGPNSLGTAFIMDVLTSNGPAPVANLSISEDEICQGGQISVNGSGSLNTTNYQWFQTDDPVTTIIDQSTAAAATFTFDNTGNHRIYLFAYGSCQENGGYIEITVNAPVAATVTPTHTTCGNNNGIITFSAPSGGDGTYYYSMDGVNFQTGNTFTMLPAGTYDVYVGTLGDNCITSYSVTINPSSELGATVSANSSVCPGGSATITAGGGLNYSWYDGAMLIASSASTLVTPAATTQYECIVTDGVGCQSTVYTTVTVNPNPATPTISASGPTTICAGGSVDLISSYPTGNVWSTTETSSDITVSSAGGYTVTHTNGNGCSSTSAVTTITVNPTPAISSGSVVDPVTCATTTGSIEVTGSGTGNVSWTGTATGSANGVTLPYVIPSLAAGSYNITFEDGIGCTSNTLNVALTDPNPPATPIITPSGATTFCAGGSVTLTSSAGTGNTWSTSAITNAINVTTSGTYSVTVTDGFGCSASSAPIVVTVNNNPAAPTITPSGATTFCNGGSVNLTSSQGSGNLWSTTQTSQQITATTSGSYTVTFTNVNGCSNTSAPVVVTVNPSPAVPTITPSGATTFCAGGSVNLTSSEVGGNTWSTSATSNMISVTTSGSFTVTYMDGNGCESTSAPTVVTVNANPAAPTITPSGATSICDGEDITLTSSQGSGNVWSTTETTNAITVNATGSYTVTYTDGNGCSAISATTNVTVNTNPTVTMTPLTTVCVYNNASPLTGGTPAGGTYSGTGVTGGNFDPATAGIGTHTITYTYTDGNGCEGMATQDITVDGCASIDENQLNSVSVYPNPTNDKLFIVLNGDFNFEILDTRGRLIETGSGSNSIELNTSNYTVGVYFVKVTSESLNTTIRVVKN